MMTEKLYRLVSLSWWKGKHDMRVSFIDGKPTSLKAAYTIRSKFDTYKDRAILVVEAGETEILWEGKKYMILTGAAA